VTTGNTEQAEEEEKGFSTDTRYTPQALYTYACQQLMFLLLLLLSANKAERRRRNRNKTSNDT
jgi:hypothetical protein